jgi:hypothetical protein
MYSTTCRVTLGICSSRCVLSCAATAFVLVYHVCFHATSFAFGMYCCMRLCLPPPHITCLSNAIGLVIVFPWMFKHRVPWAALSLFVPLCVPLSSIGCMPLRSFRVVCAAKTLHRVVLRFHTLAARRLSSKLYQLVVYTCDYLTCRTKVVSCVVCFWSRMLAPTTFCL